MFRIKKDGMTLGMTEAPNYIRTSENGCFILCPEPDALGIAFAGQVYQLLGREAVDGTAGAVALEEVDAGTELGKAAEAGGIVFVALAESGGIDVVTAAEHTELFAPWAYPVAYTAGQLRQYGGTLWRCLQGHTSQADWTPPEASSLWACTHDPAEEWPPWSAPVGVHDAYSAGDKVSHQDRHWTSTQDGNVWEPGIYGWEEVIDND